MLDEEKYPTRVLEETEEGRLLGAMPEWLRLMTIFVLQTGVRRGDVLNLRWEAVHLDYVEFVATKEGKNRTVPLNSDARAVLAFLRPQNARSTDFVFGTGLERGRLARRMKRTWNRAWRKAGVPKVRFHDLRHTALTQLVQRGTDLRTVQGIAGHASLKTTERYLHSNDRLKQEAVEKLAGNGRYTPSATEDQLAEPLVTARVN